MWFAEPECFRADQLAAMVTRSTGGELHPVLAPQAVWLDESERAAAERELAVLAARYPDFDAIARLLSRPPEACYGWISDIAGGVRLGVLVAASRRLRLIAVRDEGDVWVRTFRDERLSRTLAEILPDNVGKSAEAPISVLRSELLSAGEIGTPEPPREVRRARLLAALPPRVIAEFSVERRDRGGRHHVSSHPLRVYDTVAGRWAVRARRHYADERMDFSPSAIADIADALDKMREEL